ncbi:glycosyltransferase family 2 protein [Vannielia sp.]|uniref:glycosyltransferase family 2 protein n=1 Tax=Vannielia sp. TaxID=2813045 RepID=UPI00260D68B0|nr:glycosyltransferase family 2 protein [Vannielia sp.]MDF1872322.1 glycosyltransferase family 2 protein [Vannielia sp.]
MSAGGSLPRISVVIPMMNEAENASPLIKGICAACEGEGVAFEVVAVNDGSTDGTGAVLEGLARADPRVRVLRHAAPAGQSAAVHSGVRAARGEIICTLDGDGQNPPDQLPKLFKPLLADDIGKLALVAGQRVARQDTASKRWASKLANGLRARILKDGTRDTGCGLKGFRRDAFLGLPFFNHMHRYLPALFKRDGWEIALVDVTHAERAAGQSKYTNFGRAIVGVSDLLGVAWLIRRRKTQAPEEVKPGGGEDG